MNPWLHLLWATLALTLAALSAQARAQNASDGKTIYSTAQVTGEKSCGAGTCHGPDPATNQNAIKNGANNPSKISAAISGEVSVPDMRFLSGVLSSSMLADLAAYIANPNASNTLPVASLSSTTLGFGSIDTGRTSATQTVTVSNTGAATLQLTTITLSSAEFARVSGTCTVPSSLAIAASCTISITFSPASTGVRSATLSLGHNASGGSSVVSLAGTGMTPGNSAATTPMIEYYYAALDYYFITSHTGDIAFLDPLAAWKRTGKSFNVYLNEQPGSKGINRYYFDQIAVNKSRGSHFYTLVQAEKDALATLNPINSQAPRLPYNEDVDSYAFAPLIEGVGGSCASGLTPVYRIFRGAARFPDNPNHRFTTDTAVYNSFVALGWDGEGVKFCVPN